MKLVITGANSFIGKRLAQVAKDNGDDLVLVMRPGREGQYVPAGSNVLALDFTDYSHLGNLAGPCDCFVHLAWSGTRGSARMDTALQVQNLEASLQAVRSMLKAGCRRVVTAGSQAEYGPHSGQISEESECRPNTEYGKAKLNFYIRTAQLCRNRGVEYKEPRFFSLYGPDDFSGTMIVSILHNMRKNSPCELTECVQNWDFLYVDDAIDALYRLCARACSNGVYNFGSGDTRQLKEYVLEMAKITQTKSELRFGAVPYPETGMVTLWPDVSRLMREVNWTPQTSFERGIGCVLRAMRNAEPV